MAIGKKFKRLIAFLAIPLMLLDSVSAYAADLGASFKSAISADLEINGDIEKVNIEKKEAAETNVRKPGPHEWVRGKLKLLKRPHVK